MTTLIVCSGFNKIREYNYLGDISTTVESDCSLKNIKDILNKSIENSENEVIILAESLLEIFFKQVENCNDISLTESVFYNYPELNLYNISTSQILLSKLLDADIKFKKIGDRYFYIMKKLEFPEFSGKFRFVSF